MHSPLAMRKMQYSGLIIGVSIFLKLSTKNISYFDIEIIKAKYLFSDFCLILVQFVFAFFFSLCSSLCLTHLREQNIFHVRAEESDDQSCCARELPGELLQPKLSPAPCQPSEKVSRVSFI